MPESSTVTARSQPAARVDTPPARWWASPYLLLTLTSLFWSGNMVLARAMRNDIPPVAMGFWRWCIAALVLLPWVAPELRRHTNVIRRDWKILALLGLIGVGVFNVMCYAALRHTTATSGVLFNSTIPVWIMLLGWLAWREPLSRRRALGIFISLIGVALIVAHGDLLSLGSFRFNLGDGVLLLAMILWAVYTLLLRWKPKELSSPAFLASIILFGMPPLAIAYACEVASGARWELTIGAAASLLYYGIFPSVLAFMFFNRGVAALGPNRAGIFVHLVPVFGFLLSALLLSEPPHAYHLYGMALVLLGVWLCSAGAVKPQAVAGSEL